MKLYELSTKTIIDFPIPSDAVITAWIMIDGSWVVYSYHCGPACSNCESHRSSDGQTCDYCGSYMTTPGLPCPNPCSECCPESGHCKLCPTINNGKIINAESYNEEK